MRGIFLVFAAVFACVCARAAEPPAPKAKPDTANWFLGPFKPHLDAFDMDERGLERFPHDPVNDYNNGKAYQFWTRLGHQFTEGGREANHVDAGLRLAGRLGAAMTFSKFRAGAFNSERAPDWLSVRGVADLSKSTGRTIEYGMGVVTLQGSDTNWGGTVELRGEHRCRKPFSVYWRYAPAFLTDGRFYHELSGGAGVSWKRLGADVSYRALLNPLRNSYGPELALRLWL